MIELRWLLNEGVKPKDYALQYRYSLTPEITTPQDTVWSEWQDVPYVSED